MGNICVTGVDLGADIISECPDELEADARLPKNGEDLSPSARALWDRLDEAERRKDKQAFENNLQWLSWIAGQVWPYAHKAIVDMIKRDIEPALQEAVPGPLKGMCFTKLSLGHQAPQFGNVRLVRHKPVTKEVKDCEAEKDSLGHGAVEVEFDMEWDCAADINLHLPLGLGFNLGIKRLHIAGPVTVALAPILDTMPIVAGLRLFMLSAPQIDWDFTGIADVADHPMVASTIRKVVQQKISDIMVLPNQFYWHWVWGREHEIDVASYRFVRPIALVRIGVVEARGLTAMDWALIGKGSSDPYAITFLGTQTSHTKTIDKTLNPVWGEAAFFDFLVFARNELVHVTVFDKDLISSDDLIGKIEAVPVATLLEESGNWRQIHRHKHHKSVSTDLLQGEVRIVVESYDISITPECFSSPLKPKGSADAQFLLTVQLRCLSGLSKADSAGAIVRVVSGDRSLESRGSEYCDPASRNSDHVDPAIVQCVRFLSAEGYKEEKIAEVTAMTVERVKKVLIDVGKSPFYAYWEQNLHLLLKTLEAPFSIEVVVHSDTEAPAVFTLCKPFSIKDMLSWNSYSGEVIMEFEPKVDKDAHSPTTYTALLSSMFSKKKSKTEEKAPTDSRRLMLDVRLDLFGFKASK